MASCNDGSSPAALVEHRAHERVELDLAVRVALAGPDDDEALTRRDAHVRELQRRSLGQPQTGEQQQRDDRAVACRGLLGRLQQ